MKFEDFISQSKASDTFGISVPLFFKKTSR